MFHIFLICFVKKYVLKKPNKNRIKIGKNINGEKIISGQKKIFFEKKYVVG